MFFRRKKLFIVLALLCFQITVNGCVPRFANNNEELEARAKKLKNIRMFPPEVKIYELSAGGVSEQRDEWSATGKQNTGKAITEVLKEKGISISLLQPGQQLEGEFEDVIALHKAVMDAVYTHTVIGQGNPNIFPEKIKKFDYSVGNLEKLLNKQNGDGVLIVFGGDEISSAGRKALRVVQAINPFAQAQQSGVTFIEAALVDKSGDILWWSSFAQSGGYDLRKYESARDFVKVLLDGFPGGK